MNRTGIYSVIITLLALVLVSSGIFNAKTAINAGSALNSNSINSVAIGWQNTRYLIDKATTDAIYDDISSNGCAISQASVDSTIRTYSNAVKSEFQNLNCIISNEAISVNSGTVTHSFDLECSSNFPHSMAVKLKDSVVVKKTAAITTVPSCSVAITDNDSGLQE